MGLYVRKRARVGGWELKWLMPGEEDRRGETRRFDDKRKASHDKFHQKSTQFRYYLLFIYNKIYSNMLKGFRNQGKLYIHYCVAIFSYLVYKCYYELRYTCIHDYRSKWFSFPQTCIKDAKVWSAAKKKNYFKVTWILLPIALKNRALYNLLDHFILVKNI